MARNLSGLTSAPPGMYVDEASIGYNAWSIAHFAVDEHGFHLPLYFQAFGEYKNPLYVYALVPFLWVLPLTAAVERLPAAIFGLLAVAFIAAAAWRLSRSAVIALCILVLAGLTPWLVQESRVGFEVISMVATMSAAVWLLADARPPSRARFAAAGCLLALSVLAYSSGRLEVALFAVAFTAWYRRARGFWLTLVPIAAVYVVLFIYLRLHPGSLTSEFSIVNIGADGAPLPALIGRFLGNYVSYFSPDFLFIHGDANLRHNTDYAGMLLAVMAPLLLAGLWECLRLRSEPLPRFVISCLLLGPVAGALTYPSPHALRSAVMLPFLFVLATYGLMALGRAITARRLLLAAGAAAMLAQGSLYLLDMYSAYPQRAATAFDTGAVPAITAAARAAEGHALLVSSNINEEPYIDVFVALLPPPPPRPVDAAATVGELQALHVSLGDPALVQQIAAAGDVIVLGATDAPPPGASIVDVERAPPGPQTAGRPGPALLVVYRAGAAG